MKIFRTCINQQILVQRGKMFPGDLPGITVNDVLIVPGHNDEKLFAALDGGVYYSEDGGASWNYMGTDMPVVTVTELALDIPNQKLIAGTFSRSMFSYDVSMAR
ncbi:MAG: hypothetical protein IPO32_00890 [Crocinitomicaceae bacterium]|nr:hypothetical protein [Crocinitomicaceae bacterium]